jgi:site-specific DNA-methyltransferase (adenine-specific)
LKSHPCFSSPEKDFILFRGDCRKLVPEMDGKFDMVFADPPYFLSNGGFTIHAGRPTCVDKGKWDKSKGLAGNTEFNREWLVACREKLTDNGTIWVCGTFHNIFSVATALTDLDFRILNAITWQKTNPPPNLSCRFFTHSTEIVIWARKSKKAPHRFNYDLMRLIAGGKQMTDVWRMPAIAGWEKEQGKHPTQKPLAVVCRAILASTKENDRILDPFAGSSTTGIAANLLNRTFVGIETEREFIDLSIRRRRQLPIQRERWCERIPDIPLARRAKMSVFDKSDKSHESNRK